jgi:hypothetical protein
LIEFTRFLIGPESILGVNNEMTPLRFKTASRSENDCMGIHQIKNREESVWILAYSGSIEQSEFFKFIAQALKGKL